MRSEPETVPTPPDAPTPASGDGDEDERRMHVSFVLVRILRIVRAAFPSAVGIGLALRAIGVPGGGTTIAFAVALVAALAIVVVVVDWHRTRYAVVDGSLRLRQGVLRRSERIVPRARIAALDTSRGLLQRLFGLVSLKVQTAGGGKAAEIELPTISFAEVERLRGLLGHASVADRAAAGDEANPTVATPAPLYAIDTRELVVAALSGPQIGVVAVLLGSAASQLDDVVPRSLRDRAGDVVTSSSLTTLLLLALGLLVLAGVVAFVGTVLAYARFTVERDGDRLRIRRGVVTDRTATVALDRIHGVRIVEGLVRRRLGYAAVQVEVAGYRRENEFTRTLVPLVRRDRLEHLLPALVPSLAWTDGPLERPPARARRRYWTVPLLVSLVPAAAAVLWLPGPWRLLGVLPVVLGAALGERRWRGAGWRLDRGTLTVRWQLLARTTLLIQVSRIQIVRTRTTVMQRRARLARFSAVLATRRSGVVSHLDQDVAVALREAIVGRRHAVVGRRSLYSDAPAGVAQSVRAAES
jgi:putative membrane protein